MTQTNQIISFWDMLKSFDSGDVLTVISLCSNMQKKVERTVEILQSKEHPTIEFDSNEWLDLLAATDRIKKLSLKFSLLGVEKSCDDLSYQIRRLEGSNGYAGEDFYYHVHKYLLAMVMGFINGMSDTPVFIMSGGSKDFWEPNIPLFGESVGEAFPSISYEINEAGKCQALSRWTACVMHLMRALEIGFRAMAKHYGVDPVNDWNTILDQVQLKLKAVSTKNEGKQEEQWASEVETHFHFLKKAYRNHAMHPLARYGEEDAIEIFDNTGSFFRQLATRLGE